MSWYTQRWSTRVMRTISAPGKSATFFISRVSWALSSNSTLPSGGVTVTLEVATQHVDPDLVAGLVESIPIWREARRITNTSDSALTEVALVFKRAFSETVAVDGREVPMPTDYFRCRITITGAEGAGVVPPLERVAEFALLMENQWIARLPEVREESEGAAPDELIVYYCDMFPFQGSKGDTSTRLARRDVPGFVHTELVPAMTEAVRIQTNVWGFPWHDAWTSYRREEGAEKFSVALSGGETWYHGRAPVTGNALISLNVNGRGEHPSFDSLTDGLMSTFHHELLHNLQRSINLSQGADGRVHGGGTWHFFSEGTAMLASSVAQPAGHIATDGPDGQYPIRTTRLLGPYARTDWDLLHRSTPHNTTSDQLGFPSSTLSAPLYWRFLYEQCGGMTDGAENPAAGMAVIRSALTTLYSGHTAKVTSSTDLVTSLPRLMNLALADTPSCPFRTFEESLIHFARAIYALRLDGGRCTEPGLPTGCGHYDPDGLYAEPPVHSIAYTGANLQVPRSIRNSYGTGFMNVILGEKAQGQSLVIEVASSRDGRSRFDVQVWRLIDLGPERRPRPIPEQAHGPEVLGTVSPGGHVTYVIRAIDVAEFDRIGLIITRVDPHEESDPLGEYTIRLMAQ